MHEGVGGVVIIKGVKYFFTRHSCRVADVAAGERFAQHQNIRQHQVGNKAVSRAAKACGHFVEDQQHAVCVAQFPGSLQKSSVVHAHAARALQKGLDDHAIEAPVVDFKGPFQRVNLRGNVQHMLAGSVGLQHKVVVFIVANLHGLEGIAVIGVFQCEHHGALSFAAVYGILQRHFQRHFHGHAAGIRKECVIQIARQPALQLGGQFLRGHVGQPAQHHV